MTSDIDKFGNDPNLNMLDKSHPWAEFLEARCKAIDWMHDVQGHNDEEIAYHLSLHPKQVFLIRTRNREWDKK